MPSVHPLILRRLYRSLLKASRPFTEKGSGYLHSPKVLTCLLHRSGFGDESWGEFLRGLPFEDDAEEREEETKALFRKLLREVVSGCQSEGIRLTQLPSDVDTLRLRNIIRREFRDTDSSFSITTRKDTAFMALRELNKKLVFVESLKPKERHPQQAARNVSPLPLDPSACLRPGAYLLAHPNMQGYFRRSVICILDHCEESSDDDSSGKDDVKGTQPGTYGIIVNRTSVSPDSGRNLNLQEVLRQLPRDLLDAFGSSAVKEGGPVHMSLQMLHSATTEQVEASKIGGCIVPAIPSNEGQSTALETDKALYYRGDIMKAANAVASGKMDREDVSFFVGASVWDIGQLENELALGHWLVCRGPTDIAQSGMCEHDATPQGQPRPEADLWLSMVSSCGEEEAELAHLLYHDNGRDENSRACDDC